MVEGAMTGFADEHPRAWKCVMASILVFAAAGGACGGSSGPTAPSGSGTSGSGGSTTGTCRTYATAATVTTTALGPTQNQSLTGSFDPATTKSTVTTLFANGSVCSTTVSSYRSTADFVDEVRVIPGVTLATTAVTTTSGAC